MRVPEDGMKYSIMTVSRTGEGELTAAAALLPATASILTFGQMVADNKELLSIFFGDAGV